MAGDEKYRVDFQVHCGPALGAFNQWVRGTARESWRNRHVDEIGELMMRETATCLERRLERLVGAGNR
jgi:trans-AT polyketide synthase/acyltransferase/oxidoreductase domain-containing protein